MSTLHDFITFVAKLSSQFTYFLRHFLGYKKKTLAIFPLSECMMNPQFYWSWWFSTVDMCEKPLLRYIGDKFPLGWLWLWSSLSWPTSSQIRGWVVLLAGQSSKARSLGGRGGNAKITIKSSFNDDYDDDDDDDVVMKSLWSLDGNHSNSRARMMLESFLSRLWKMKNECLLFVLAEQSDSCCTEIRLRKISAWCNLMMLSVEQSWGAFTDMTVPRWK